MNVLKTILDFILSVTRLFFRGKEGGRQFCPQCGALLRADRPCGCNRETTGSGTGGSRGNYEPAREEESAENDGETEEKEVAGHDICKPSGATLNTVDMDSIATLSPANIAGWCLFIMAVVSMLS